MLQGPSCVFLEAGFELKLADFSFLIKRVMSLCTVVSERVMQLYRKDVRVAVAWNCQFNHSSNNVTTLIDYLSLYCIAFTEEEKLDCSWRLTHLFIAVATVLRDMNEALGECTHHEYSDVRIVYLSSQQDWVKSQYLWSMQMECSKFEWTKLN